METAATRRGRYSTLVKEAVSIFQQIPPVQAVVEVGEDRAILVNSSLDQEQAAEAMGDQ
jgi:hypothetical protein